MGGGKQVGAGQEVTASGVTGRIADGDGGRAWGPREAYEVVGPGRMADPDTRMYIYHVVCVLSRARPPSSEFCQGNGRWPFVRVRSSRFSVSSGGNVHKTR